MGRAQRIGRGIIAGLAAYALVLHVLMMAGLAAPSHVTRHAGIHAGHATAMAGAAHIICHGAAGEGHHDPAPAPHPSTSSACALCSLGGSGPPLPALAVVPPPVVTGHVPVFVAQEPPPPARRTVLAAQPRAPPAFA